jgi:hypothetical protein
MFISSGIKLVCFNKILVTSYKTTWCHNPENRIPYFNHHEKLKSHVQLFCKQQPISRILGSHGSEYEDGCLLEDIQLV